VTAFFVPGIPAPQGSKSFKGFANGKPILAESSAKVKPWRTAVAFIAAERSNGQAPTAAVVVDLRFVLPRPRSVTVKRRPVPCVKPDLDKLIRSTLDGLTDSGLFHDDAQVVAIYASKAYADDGEPVGCHVEVAAA
jgi:Holliday junction resolvase RusA-like endonuclease